MKHSDKQVGGNHYKGMAIQPTDFIALNDIPFIEGNVIKYVCRHEFKNGKEDIMKAIHYLNLLLEYKYPEHKHSNESNDISESLQEVQGGLPLHRDSGSPEAYPGGEVCNND